MRLPITPYKIKKAFLYWRHFGTREFFNHLADRLEAKDIPYDAWRRDHCVREEELARQAKCTFPSMPLISIVVPAYHTPKQFLLELIESVERQSYANWELCIADAGASDEAGEAAVGAVVRSCRQKDSRIRYLALEQNYNIAENTNRAIGMAKGDYLAFLDHDDLIEPDALFEFVRAINESGADLLYTDEDKVRADRSRYYQPHFKPEFNLDLLRSNNYITHFLCVKKTLAEEAGVFDPALSGAQDYDFIFRCVEKAQKIVRIPRVLYHWRTHQASTADNPMSKLYAYDAGQRAIEGHLKRCGVKGRVEQLPDLGFYRVRYPVEGQPLVSVLIPNKDQAEMLKTCIDAVLAVDYDNIEIIVIENNSTEPETFAYYKELEGLDRVRVVRWEGGFNYSAINNYGATFAQGDYLLLLNNDVRGTISRTWLKEMLGVCQRPDVGAVGARLYYPDNRIQHAGIVIGIGGIAGSMFVDLPRGRSGYLHKAALMQDLSAVTAACMMVKRSVFYEVGGLTEDLAVAFNDVDFCLKIVDKGYRIVYDPYAELYHDESRTRGAEDSKEKVRRFQGEIEYMRSHWSDILKKGDPMYNPNLSLKKWNYSLKV